MFHCNTAQHLFQFLLLIVNSNNKLNMHYTLHSFNPFAVLLSNSTKQQCNCKNTSRNQQTKNVRFNVRKDNNFLLRTKCVTYHFMIGRRVYKTDMFGRLILYFFWLFFFRFICHIFLVEIVQLLFVFISLLLLL
jgi:hypothetical protein